MNPTRYWPALIAACSLACGSDVVTPAALERAAGSITETDIRDRISVLADDSMRGRDTPSPELDQAAAWIASEFESMGLDPAFDGGFVQTYAIRQVAPDLVASSAWLDGEPLALGEDLAPTFGPSEGVLEGQVVVLSGSRGWEDAVTEEAVRGNHVVWVQSAGRNGVAAPAFPVVQAARGAGAASLLIASDESSAAWRRNVDLRARQTALFLGEEFTGTPMLGVRDVALRDRFDLDVEALRARGAERMDLEATGLTLRLELMVRAIEESEAPNVAAVLEGADAALANEYVLFSAHMDHVGVGRPDLSGDSIFNGADDDASGTATVMELAEAFSMLPTPPRRSMIFLLVSGEEKGLWGARAFVAAPPVGVDRIVADLNLDMVGRNWPDTIVAIGREHSDLGRTLEEVEEAHPELGMAVIDDPWPEENFYGRSDHFIFARAGVPILFFFNGTHEDYHRPSDEVEKIDAEKTSRIARLVFYLGAEVAVRENRPEWNRRSYRRIVEQRE